MRKVFLFMMVSLDGYFEGTNHDISWHNANNDEFEKYVHEQNSRADTILFGARTYEMMYSFWPSPDALKADAVTARFMNETSKVVFSRTLDRVDWQNSRLVKGNSSEEVRKLKSQTGGDIAVLGSNNFATSLIGDKLIDEFKIMVNPVVLGAGTSLFKGLSSTLNLKLTSSHEFKSGNVLLTYTCNK